MDKNAAYSQAGDEIERDAVEKALWYQAFAERGGELQATKARYIELRVAELLSAQSQHLHTGTKPASIPESSSLAPIVTAAVRDYSPSDQWDTTPRPWRRFWARVIDNSLYAVCGLGSMGMLVGIMVGLGVLQGSALHVFENQVAMAILLCPIAMVLEGALFAFGVRPPGKALLGIRVVSKESESMPGFMTTAYRVLQLWVRGMWLGIPLLSLIAMALMAGKLRKNGETSYDKALGLKVESIALPAWRVVAAVAVITMLFFVAVIVTVATKHM